MGEGQIDPGERTHTQETQYWGWKARLSALHCEKQGHGGGAMQSVSVLSGNQVTYRTACDPLSGAGTQDLEAMPTEPF